MAILTCLREDIAGIYIYIIKAQWAKQRNWNPGLGRLYKRNKDNV